MEDSPIREGKRPASSSCVRESSSLMNNGLRSKFLPLFLPQEAKKRFSKLKQQLSVGNRIPTGPPNNQKQKTKLIAC